MEVSKVYHRANWRIRVDFPYDSEISAQLKKLSDARWSKTMKAWHIPYTREAFEQLRELFPELTIAQTSLNSTGEDFYEASRSAIATEISKEEKRVTIVPSVQKIAATEEIKKPAGDVDNSKKPVLKKTANLSDKLNPEVEITVTPMHLFVKLQKNETDIQFLKSFKFIKWDNANYQWVIPNYKRNLNLLQSFFEGRRLQVNEKVSLRVVNNTDCPTVDRGQLLAVNLYNHVLKLYFGYNSAIIEAIRRLPLCRWNGLENCWTLPYSEPSVKYIREFAVANELEWIYREEKKSKVLPGNRGEVMTRINPETYLAKLRELRYSQNTIDSYTYMFREFINYYPDKELEDITEEEIVLYLQYLVTERNVSTSYQNQAINAIKFYYERVMGGRRKVYLIERPREEKYLPEVLSQEEVTALLNATDNLKHKAILTTIYSGGLRVSEAVHLKIKDIDSNRMQIRVSQSKGKKDRYTLLSKKALEILRKYVSEYKPKDWLFEGHDGEEYSRRTITEILRKSVEKTGIKKHITVHTLRHSFATHLLEAGTDIRYIQNLLGHENTKTTEIYTHITTKGFDQIKSPLDNLDIK